MGTMILLRLFILAVILVSVGQAYLLARYLLWPRICRVTHCPWCWKEAEIANDFPPPWSSTICPYHDRQIRAQARARRPVRRSPATPAMEPAAVVWQAEEGVQIWV